jgi:D-ribose pyranose/furanose isomerase RbsD
MAKQRDFPRPTGTPPTPPSLSIDLHGYRKSEGIKALTLFLEEVVSRSRMRTRNGDVWVLVVTGSGAHSSEGPVLRDAVKNLLEKRQMEYSINRGKGSFTVNANSGITFYDPKNPVDSKIILKEPPEKIPALPKGPRKGVHTGLVYDDDAPTPLEVACIDKAITESRTELLKVFNEEKREEMILKRVASMSLLEAKQEEEHEMIQRALSMSLIESNCSEASCLDHDLQRALELSQTDFEQRCDFIEEELQMALELSKNLV